MLQLCLDALQLVANISMMDVIYFFLGKIQRGFNRYTKISERLHNDMYGWKTPLAESAWHTVRLRSYWRL